MAMAMAKAPSSWSELPSDILSKISKILNTDVDILRLRSICSFWRSSIPRRLRPSSFPLRLPPLWNRPSSDRLYFLNYSTLYSLSRPEIGPRAGDPSDSWLFRALEVRPNRFSILSPLVPVKADYAPGTIPDSLNLLEYRITEISKCFGMTSIQEDGSVLDLLGCREEVGDIAVLFNDFEFVVIVFLMNGHGRFWKYGDEDWTPIDVTGHAISDLIVCSGICYAITDDGLLLSFDSNLGLSVTAMPPIPVDVSSSSRTVYYLLAYKSELYVVSRIYEEVDNTDYDNIDTEFRLKIFKKCYNHWEHIHGLPDEFFISCEDVSVGLPAQDFISSKRNCVHVSISNVLSLHRSSMRVSHYGICDLADDSPAVMKLVKNDSFMNWPPPWWLSV